MHIVRILFIATIVLVGSSEAIFLKNALLAKAAAAKAGFVADVKASALAFKTGVALQKKALLGGLRAVGKAKLGFLAGVKAAKLGVLKSVATAKLAKLAAIKAGKVAFVKTLVAAKLAPIVAKKVGIGSAILGKGAIAGSVLKGPALLPLAAQANPLVGLVTGALSQAQSLAGNVNLPALLGNVGATGGLPLLFPPPSQPSVRIETYKPDESPVRSYAPALPPSTYGPPAPAMSYGPPTPVKSYGVPGYY